MFDAESKPHNTYSTLREYVVAYSNLNMKAYLGMTRVAAADLSSWTPAVSPEQNGGA